MHAAVAILLAALAVQNHGRPYFPTSAEVRPCADHYYNFEFDAASACAKRAYIDSGRSLEAAYWYSKTLWVAELDRLMDVNQNLLAAVLEKEPVRQRVNPAVRTEFASVLAEGIARAQKTPDDEAARYYLGALYGNQTAWSLLLEGRKLEAVKGVKRTMNQMNAVLAANPRTVEAYALLGMGNYLLATNPWYVRMLTFMLGTSGDKTVAIRQLRLAADSEVEDARFLLKSVLAREGDLTGAADLLGRLLQRYPRNVFFAVERGDLLARLGRPDDARREYQRAEKLIAGSSDLQRRFGPTFIELRLRKLEPAKGRTTADRKLP